MFIACIRTHVASPVYNSVSYGYCKSLRTFKISTFSHHGKHKKKIAHLDLCQFEFVEIENTKSISDVNYGIYWENSIDQVHY